MKGTVIHCQWCRQNGPSAMSHIHPIGFGRHLLRASKFFLRVSFSRLGEQEKEQTTPFQRNLLCQRCEGWSHHLDDYLIDVFRDRKGITFEPSDVAVRHWMHGVDHDLLRRAILFALWRYLASSRPDYRMFKYPMAMERVRNLLRSGEPISPRRFGIMLTHRYGSIVDEGPWGRLETFAWSIIFQPRIVDEYAGHRTGVMFFADFEVRVALDPLPLSRQWQLAHLPANGPIPVLMRAFADSPDLRQFEEDALAWRKTMGIGEPSTDHEPPHG